MSSQNLPPIRHLPRWPRVGRLENPCSPRRVATTAVVPVPDVPTADSAVRKSPGPICQSDADPRLASLQRNIRFLQQQHRGTLEQLHAEIESLRRENKELQYKLIMEPRTPSTKEETHSQKGIRSPTQGSEPHSVEEPLQEKRPTQEQALSFGDSSNGKGSARQDFHPEVKGGFITSLQPLRIHSSPSHQPRAPTVQECEVIIRQLYHANGLQSQEIIRVKALLKEIVLSKKITPENYILTKAYLVDGTRKLSEEKKFPKLGHQTSPEKILQPSQSGVVLPALKQTLNSTIAERQRRSRAVQKDRFKRSVK